ncbi:MAG: ABC transporter ATP-binding protein [Limisphaerales bacterium]|jgi:lipoprotein-releasing system ATP-binding protein
MTSPLLQLMEVDKEYPAATEAGRVFVLQGVNFELGAGESVAVVGPSGCGKSTLLNIMGTLDEPTRGRVRLGGEDLAGLKGERLAEVRNRSVGFVFQAHHLLPQCTVMENVLVPTLAARDAAVRSGARERAKRLLDKVGLGARLGHRPGQLSGGERQRVAVVRALINGPKLLLADEPTGALDRASAEALGDLLQQLNREEGVALVVVTHALELARRMGRTLELRDGVLSARA